MNEFLRRITTSLNWFIGFVVLLVFFILFVWRLVDHDGYNDAINGFMKDLWEMAKFFIALAVIAVAFKLMIFGGKKSGGKGH